MEIDRKPLVRKLWIVLILACIASMYFGIQGDVLTGKLLRYFLTLTYVFVIYKTYVLTKKLYGRPVFICRAIFGLTGIGAVIFACNPVPQGSMSAPRRKVWGTMYIIIGVVVTFLLSMIIFFASSLQMESKFESKGIYDTGYFDVDDGTFQNCLVMQREKFLYRDLKKLYNPLYLSYNSVPDNIVEAENKKVIEYCEHKYPNDRDYNDASFKKDIMNFVNSL